MYHTNFISTSLMFEQSSHQNVLSQTLAFSTRPLQIKSMGFQFLLHSPHEQLWGFLLQYLHLMEVGVGCHNRVDLTFSLGVTNELGQCFRVSLHPIDHELGRVNSSTFLVILVGAENMRGCVNKERIKIMGALRPLIYYISPSCISTCAHMHASLACWSCQSTTAIQHSPSTPNPC